MGRGREEEFFARILMLGVRDGFLPSLVRVYGRPGSGKTVVVRGVLERFEGFRGDVFRHFYVNLKGCRTVFSAGNAVLSVIAGRSVPANLGLDRVFSEIWSEIRGLKDAGVSFICLVFDEIDSIFLDKHYDPSDFLYRFLRHDVYLEGSDVEFCLIAITNNPLFFEDNLDAKVRSSMGSDAITFPPYSMKEIVEILDSRLGEAFKTGMISEGLIPIIAKLVTEKTGDARRAVDLLRLSGEVANEKKSRVDADCVYEALDRVEKDWASEQLHDLPFNSALILLFIAYLTTVEKSVSTGELYEVYRKTSVRGKEIRILGERRLSEIVSELETLGLISTWNVSRGRYGYHREIKMVLNPHQVLKILKDKFGIRVEPI